MAKPATKPEENVSALSFEEALKELESIVRNLESGDRALEDAIADFTRGNALKEHCAKKLADAKLKVEKLNINPSTGDVAGAQAFEEMQ